MLTGTNHYYVVEAGRNCQCLYASTGGMMEYFVNGKQVSRPCDRIGCPKHTHIARGRYSEEIQKRIEGEENCYMLTLPIGDLLCRQKYTPLWESFYFGMRRIFKGIDYKYIIFKELQNENLHLHGILITSTPIDTVKVRKVWEMALEDNLGRRPGIENIECDSVHSKVGASKYIAKDLVDNKGLQIAPKALIKKYVQMSRGFFNRQGT